MRRSTRSAPVRALVLPAVLLTGLAAAPVAQAHPLGNFSLNHYDGLRLTPHRIQDTAVVDAAEIPTAQDRDAADRDHDGRVSAPEAKERATERCAGLAGRTRVSVGGERPEFRVDRGTLTYRKGAAGLQVSRLSCTLHAEADLTQPARVSFASGSDRARTGWKEITAVGNGVRLTDSSVPASSSSGALRRYPSGAGDQPLDTVTAALRATPAVAEGREAGMAPQPDPGSGPSPTRGAVLFPGLEDELTALTTERDLTFPVGLLAVVLTLLLGAGHAALPGHAKLAVAACLARRKGGVRAALGVGATVTVTHTAGVLTTGLLLTASGGLLGEQLLGWLGALSGALITAIGVGLVISALRALRTGKPAKWHHGHTHDHGHGHGHGHTHDHGHDHDHGHTHTQDDEDGHHHDRPPYDHAPPHQRVPGGSGGASQREAAAVTLLQRHDDADADADTDAEQHKVAPDEKPASGRAGLPALLGIGLAGGLVPSPSALVVLLGAIALSRTAFGVLLVFGYGLGMAATLTLAGLLLSGGGNRLAALGERRLPALRRFAPYGTMLTALVILTVGAGLTLRSLFS